MTEKEKELLAIIEKNPQISQNDLAKRLKMTRSSVSVHINNLSKKGYIAGRGYVLNPKDYVMVIGAANTDILGFSSDTIIPKDSNPGHIKICLGGVGRNVSENLARLQTDVKFITTIGDDVYGRHLLDQCISYGIDMRHAYSMKGEISSIYMAIMNKEGSMELALSDMTTLDKLPNTVLNQKSALIKRAQLVMVDTGLSKNSLEYITANFTDVDLYLDPVSVGKAEHVKHLISSFHTIKMNRLECEYLSDMPIKNMQDLVKASDYFMNIGIQSVFITLGKDGVFARDRNQFYYQAARSLDIVNETGAGDAFMAGIIYSRLHGYKLKETCEFASALAEIALMSEETVSPLVSIENVEKNLKEIKS